MSGGRGIADKQLLAEILDGKNPQMMVKLAEDIAGKQLIIRNQRGELDEKRSVSTSQIRNIYGTVKGIEVKGDVSKDVIFKLILLKPKLAYVAGRHDKVPGMEVLRRILSDSIDLVYEKNERFDKFCNFFEAILAYHKAFGGK